jgi:hypothetical protein
MWYTGSSASRIGRIDVANGQITEYRMPTEGSAPTGLVSDTAGNLWVTANAANSVIAFANNGSVANLLPPNAKRGVADLDGTGKSPLLLRDSFGQLQVGRLINNEFVFTAAAGPAMDSRLLGIGDFDGDGLSDIAFQNMVQDPVFGDVRSWKTFDQTKSVLWRQVKKVWDVQAIGDLDGDGKGVLTGASWDPAAMLRVLRGSPDFAALPAESVNYISAHDNMTLRDKLARVFGTGPDSDRVDAAVRAGITVTMLAHGIPFIEGGIEIGRTKGGNHNSYNAGDKVNQYVWRTLTPADAQCISHISGLAAVRKAHPAFRSNTRLSGPSVIKQVRTGLPEQVLAWELDGTHSSDPWKTIRVIVNLSQKRVDITGMERWQLGYSDDALGIRASAGAGMVWQLEPGGTVVLHNS